MKQRSPTSQMFRFLLNVQTFYPTGFFIVQYKKNKIKQIWIKFLTFEGLHIYEVKIN